jgi:4'-phosphopantetheinyl transferase
MQLFAMRINETNEQRATRVNFLEAVLGQDAVRHIQYTLYKKPYIPGGPHFNLSHSGQWLFLAVADSPVGVDIERHKPNRDFAGIARRAFFSEDYEAVMLADERMQAFYDQWVRKESYLKMKGTGFFADDRVNTDYATAQRDADIRLYHQFPGYSAAVACRLGTNWPEEAILISLAESFSRK